MRRFRCVRRRSQSGSRRSPVTAAAETARTPRRRHRGLGVRASHERAFGSGTGPGSRRRAGARQRPFVPAPADAGGAPDPGCRRAHADRHDLGDARLPGDRVGRRLSLRAPHLLLGHDRRGPLRLRAAHREHGRRDLRAVGLPPDARPAPGRSLDAVEPLPVEASATDRRAALGPASRAAHLGSQEGPRAEQPAAPAPRPSRHLWLAQGAGRSHPAAEHRPRQLSTSITATASASSARPSSSAVSPARSTTRSRTRRSHPS